MVRRLEHHELKRDCLRTQRILPLNLDIVHFLLTILVANLGGRVPQDVAVSHAHQLNLILVRKVDYFEQVHDSVLEVRHFQPHQVVKPSRLHHVLHLLGQRRKLRVSLLLSNVVKQVVKDITNHLDLLLALQVVIDLARSLISHKLLSSISLHPLKIS